MDQRFAPKNVSEKYNDFEFLLPEMVT